MGNELGPVTELQVKDTVDRLMGLINPNETLQQRVVIECTSLLSMDFPRVSVVYNRHCYYVFLNLGWFRYLLFTLFVKKNLVRDMSKEIKEVDPNFRGVAFFNKLSQEGVGLIKN
jgi:hypothetical protein